MKAKDKSKIGEIVLTAKIAAPSCVGLAMTLQVRELVQSTINE
jgi:hypothetical protein